MRPGLRTPSRVEAALHAGAQLRQRRPPRLEHRRRGANRLRRRDQRGVSAGGFDRGADGGGAAVGAGLGLVEAEPDEAAAPVVEDLRRRQRRDGSASATRRPGSESDRAARPSGRRGRAAATAPSSVQKARFRARRAARRGRGGLRARRRDRRPTAAGLRAAEGGGAEPRRTAPTFDRRAAAAGRCAAPETSNGEFSASASAGSRPRRRARATTSVHAVSGFGDVLTVISVRADSVP